MNKCLVTKLNGVVSDKSLTPLGCVAFTAYPSNNTLKLECSGNNVEYFTANGEAVFSTDKSNFVNRISANRPVFVKIDKPTLIFISNKYELTKVDIYDSAPNSQLDIDFNDFKYCKKVEAFNIGYYKKLTGDISPLSSLTSLQTLKLNNTSVSGDISSLRSLTSLQTLTLYNTSVSGDISPLRSLTGLQKLQLDNTSVSGDISSLRSLTSLHTLQLNDTSVSGDISPLSSLTGLRTLTLHNTSTSGNISSFNNMIELQLLKMGKQGTGYFKPLCSSLKDNGKTSGTLTFWAYGGQVKIDDKTNCPNNDVIATFSEEGVSYSGL